jgi:hypothetical protein
MCDQKISYGLKRMTLRIWLNIENIYVSRGQKQNKMLMRILIKNLFIKLCFETLKLQEFFVFVSNKHKYNQ